MARDPIVRRREKRVAVAVVAVGVVIGALLAIALIYMAGKLPRS